MNLGLGGMLGGIPNMKKMTIAAAQHQSSSSPRRHTPRDKDAAVSPHHQVGTAKGRRHWMQFKSDVLKKAAKPHLAYHEWTKKLKEDRTREANAERDNKRRDLLRTITK